MCLAAVYTAFGFTAASTSAGTLRQSVVISATCAFCMLAICKSCTVFEHVYDFVRRNDYKNTTNDSLRPASSSSWSWEQVVLGRAFLLVEEGINTFSLL